MYRDSEQQLKSAVKHLDVIDTYLYLCKVYIRLDQPLTAIDIYKQGLEKFPNETSLLSGIARIYDVRLSFSVYQMSRIARIFAHAKTKAQISFAVTSKLISAFVFATQIVQFLFFLYPKFQPSSLLL